MLLLDEITANLDAETEKKCAGGTEACGKGSHGDFHFPQNIGGVGKNYQYLRESYNCCMKTEVKEELIL